MFLTPGSDFSQAQRILPNESVNGVMTRHYRATHNEIALAASGFTNYVVDIWVAVDGGYVVRQTLSADGTAVALSGTQGHIEWTYDVLDINSPLNISVPEGCAEPAAPGEPAGGEMPVMPDAATVTVIGTTTTYTTPSSASDVAAFYTAQMPGLGWTPGTVTQDGSQILMDFTRGAETATMAINEGDGITFVLAAIE
jgi:hypothetical protein